MIKPIAVRAAELYGEEVADKDIIIPTDYEVLLEEVIVSHCDLLCRWYRVDFLNDPGLFNLSSVIKQVANNEYKENSC
jgi:hypothetical protein